MPTNLELTLNPLKASDFGPRQARHLLRRVGFGSTPQQVNEAINAGPQKTVNQLLANLDQPLRDGQLPEVDPDVIRPPNAEERATNAKARREGDQDTIDAFRSEQQRRRQQDRRMMGQLRRWWIGLMTETDAPLRENLTLLWHGHFATAHRNVRDTNLMWQQNQLFRTHAGGNFANLLTGIVRDPAMLRYLNNDRNNKRRPNENLAREIMELFSLGEGNYTEQDIKQAAKALTGYHVRDNDFLMRDGQHDGSAKTVLGETDTFNGDDLAQLLLDQQACSEFIAYKLVRHFVADIDGWPSSVPSPLASMTRQIAQLLWQNNYDLKPVLAALFQSRFFYSEALVGKQIKSPTQLIVGTARMLHTPGPPARSLNDLDSGMRQMGQQLFDPPSVAGWDGGRSWINTSTLFTRQNTCAYMITGIRPNRKFNASRVRYEPMTLVSELLPETNTKDVQAKTLVDAMVDQYVGEHIPAARREPLVSYLKDKPLNNESMIGVLTLLTAMPEYQLI